MPDSFVFVGEHLALDFLNTEVMVRNKPRDLLASLEDLRHWHAVAQTYHPELVAVEFGDTAFHKVLILRGAVRRIVMSTLQENVPSKADMDTLNRFFARERLQIEAVGPRLFQQYYTGDKSGLITLATAAAHLLVQTDLSRLHQCKNERCILLFYDTTKNGARRWCTPDCQNRARSIEHYHKRREGD